MIPTPQLLSKVENFIKDKGKNNYFCLFLLGKEAGLRVSEAVNFDLSLKKKPNLYLIQGKRHKKRTIYIDPSVITELKQNHWKPQQTNRFSFAHFLQRTKKELNISKEIELTPHTLRRCFATYQANSGMPLPVLQQVLGHSSIRTTALYWKNTQEPKEKFFNDKWLAGKLPKEPVKPIENKPKNLLKPSENENSTEIPPNIQNNPRNSQLEFLTAKNKLLQEKVKKLEQAKSEQEQIITNLRNDKEKLEKQLIQVQSEKETLLKLLSSDLQVQHNNLLEKPEKPIVQELHQQLIAQIQVLTKN